MSWGISKHHCTNERALHSEGNSFIPCLDNMCLCQTEASATSFQKIACEHHPPMCSKDGTAGALHGEKLMYTKSMTDESQQDFNLISNFCISPAAPHSTGKLWKWSARLQAAALPAAPHLRIAPLACTQYRPNDDHENHCARYSEGSPCQSARPVSSSPHVLTGFGRLLRNGLPRLSAT